MGTMAKTGECGWSNFDEFFKTATGFKPFPYQRRLALDEPLPALVDIPTGAGKTAAVILAWLWRRRFASEKVHKKTPRRLVYCLPMRVLVEQTRDNAVNWLFRLNLLGGKAFVDDTGKEDQIIRYEPTWNAPDKIAVTVLMGGEDADEWDLYPERDAIIIGTQDMLLSRALNRGYGMSRYRWPMHFGLLSNDCLWAMDEVQLMGNGLATSVQLEAFRNQIGTIEPAIAKTVWMSATLNREWLKTVDFDPIRNIPSIFNLSQDDFNDQKIESRVQANKTLKKSIQSLKDTMAVAEGILEKHQKSTRTLVILNTVKRALDLHSALKKKHPEVALILIHSRFRPLDRKEMIRSLLADPGPDGTIVISTQVIEAGVDISAKTMFTELAPWPSLVQRFGRCNRFGEHRNSEIYWIDVPTGEKSQASPYSDKELDDARQQLEELEGNSVGPSSLPKFEISIENKQIIRRKDIVELFDTTLDLAGHDIDISRFIREASDTDVQVFWRELSDEATVDKEPRPHRNELCSVPIADIRDLVKKNISAWYWDQLEGDWSRIQPSTPISPGLIIMLRSSDGHYLPDEGWNVKSKNPVHVVRVKKKPPEKYAEDEKSRGDWKSIAEHTDDVGKIVNRIINIIGLGDQWQNPLLEAARWHDAGKAHNAFQAKIKSEELKKFSNYLVAKAPEHAWKQDKLSDKPVKGDDRRKYFRHELASGVLALQNGKSDLIAYLAATHHGKVRLSIRSMPDEFPPPNDETRFARGVWDGDKIPSIDLGGGLKIAETCIDLSYMELGEGPNGPSWMARMLVLRDKPEVGIFRLAYLEALLKAADERASGGTL